MKSVNLIPAARRDAKRRRQRRATCALACGAYAALLACGLGAAHLMWNTGDGLPPAQRLAATEEDIRRFERQASDAQAELAKTRATLEANRVVAEQPDWSVLLALLSRTIGEDVVLQAVSVAPPVLGTAAAAAAPATPAAGGAAKPLADVVLELTGVGRSQLSVSRHVLRLEQTGLFSKVTLLDTSRQPYLNGPAIVFRLQCTFGAPPQPGASPAESSASASGFAADAGGTSR